MESVRILLAMSSDTSITKLRAILVENGYTVVDHAREGNECMRKVRALKPDILMVDYNLSMMNGYEVATVALEDKLCDVVLLATEAEKGMLDYITEVGFVCMTKPLNRPNLLNTIELMVKAKKKIRDLENEIDTLKATLDTRKEVEKAKGLLMKHLNLTEPEAFKRIQKQSMDRGIAMKEIAKAIILAYDI